MHSLTGNLACWVATYVVNALWQVPLIAAAGWFASRMLGRLGPRVQHIAWAVTFCLSIALPALPVLRAVTAAMGGGGAGHLAQFSVVLRTSASAAAASTASLLLPGWAIEALFVLYGALVVGGAVRLLWLVRRTALLVNQSGPVVLEGERKEAWERCRHAFGVEGAKLLTSRDVRGVVTLGMRLLVPEGFAAECTEQEFLTALGHECAHMRRRDSAKNLMYQAASVLMTFHPVAWMVKAQVAQTREMVCDAMVVEKLVEARSYTQSLLHLAERMLRAGVVPIHAIGIFDANALEKRIMQIKARKRQASAPARWALVICGTLLLASAAAMGIWLGTGVRARAANHTTSDAGQVYQPGDGVTNPVLTYAPDPEFSEAARRARYQGVCVVGLIVDAQGDPQQVHVVRPLGMGLDEKALEAVRQYRFRPAMYQGHAVPVEIKIEVNFRIY